jgi:hypothetical protein
MLLEWDDPRNGPRISSLLASLPVGPVQGDLERKLATAW